MVPRDAPLPRRLQRSEVTVLGRLCGAMRSGGSDGRGGGGAAQSMRRLRLGAGRAPKSLNPPGCGCV
eukprot:851005-Rhodomonas_salina.2